MPPPQPEPEFSRLLSRPRLVMLDRDGVINEDSPGHITSVSEWRPLPGALDALGRLYRAGFLLSLCTNQSGVGRGLLSEATLEAIHDRLRAALREAGAALAMLSYCPHRPDAGCRCRKPVPGMLLDQLQQLRVAPSDAVFVGDSERDVAAAYAAGVRGWLVRTGNGKAFETRLKQGPEQPSTRPDAIFDSLTDVADALLRLPERQVC